MGDDEPTFLDKAYDLGDVQHMGEHYDRWADTYEKELLDNGYVTPARCAAALSAHAPDLSLPIVDLGCGTGLSGVALRKAGFTTIDGYDFSQQMLAHARRKDDVYRRLGPIDLSTPLPFQPAEYAHACAAGVISPGHAPMETIRYTLNILPLGGCLALSLNDHALEEGFDRGVRAVLDDGTAELLVENYAEHIPGIALRSTVYLLRRITR